VDGFLARWPLGFAADPMKMARLVFLNGLALASALGYPKTLVRIV